MRTPLAERARGHWASLLPELGVDRRYLTAKQGPCRCVWGKTRFRFDDKEGRGTWDLQSLRCRRRRRTWR